MIYFNPLGVSSIWSMFSEVSGGLCISDQKATLRLLKLLPDVSTRLLNFVQYPLQIWSSRAFWKLEIFNSPHSMIPISLIRYSLNWNHMTAHFLYSGSLVRGVQLFLSKARERHPVSISSASSSEADTQIIPHFLHTFMDLRPYLVSLVRLIRRRMERHFTFNFNIHRKQCAGEFRTNRSQIKTWSAHSGYGQLNYQIDYAT